ncbi:DUF3558 family protein [Nocardia sp. NPDC058666]|uniref:DUF3558 family protein n=1 Tax=Nocardia sp. NPDC058666 TaxID=3346587 RepID=UPI003668E924
MALTVGGLASVALLGCSGDESEAARPLFEPCAGVAVEALQKAGVDPATKVAAGAPAAGWLTCEWTAGTSHLRIFSTSRTIEEFESESGAAAFADFAVAGRTARQLMNAAPASCDVLFPAEQGVIRMVVVNSPTHQGSDACATLRQMGEVLVPTFPA